MMSFHLVLVVPLCLSPLALPTPRGYAFTSDRPIWLNVLRSSRLEELRLVEAALPRCVAPKLARAVPRVWLCVALLGAHVPPLFTGQERVCGRTVLARGACPSCGTVSGQTNIPTTY